jgi:tetratricopeptide (TPR) repeat protein
MQAYPSARSKRRQSARSEKSIVSAYSKATLATLLLAALCAAQNDTAPLVKEGDSAFAQGDYDAARSAFEKANQIAQKLPPASPVRYDVLKRLTATSAASGQFADAARYNDQAIKWRESVNKKDPKIADDLLLSVSFQMRQHQFDEALATAQRVQSIHTAAFGAESLPAADDLLRIGEIYLVQKKTGMALRSLIKARDLRTSLTSSLDPTLLPTLDRINEAFGTGNEMIFRQALLIRETLYGANSPELINTVEGFANFYQAQGMLPAAEPLYLRLLALWEVMAGDKNHPMIAVTLDKLVVLYVKEGELDKARAALGRSVDIRAHFLAVGLSHQAADEIAQDHPERAKALYRRALVALGPSDEEAAVELKQALSSLEKSK